MVEEEGGGRRERGGSDVSSPRFSAVDSGAEAVAELDAAILAADPGYTCLYDALQAGPILNGAVSVFE